LPIEEENYQPGSPILSSQNYSSPIDHNEVEGALPRHSSMLSTTTADDEDLGDEFKGPNTGRPTVPTLIEWEGEGERVYATGTFAGWNRKYRLHRKWVQMFATDCLAGVREWDMAVYVACPQLSARTCVAVSHIRRDW
jgi:hypothetical protein